MPETRENYISVRYPVVSFVPSYREVVCDGTFTMDVVVDELSTGLSGYVLNVSFENHGIGDVVGVSYPSWARLNSTSGLPGDVVRLSAVDLDKVVEAGTTNVTLATLTIKGDAPGTASIMYESVRVESDDNGMTITTAPVNGAMSVYATIAADFSANATASTVGPLSPFVVGFTDNPMCSPTPSSWEWSLETTTPRRFKIRRTPTQPLASTRSR
ncbi:hypothetical protein Mtc_1687 [Methanocella conradii HZ254]|uniref:Cohesin domain-containing protein n=1 Tax=Methanocella conradii (strain DSM 24694 / JCM 17849 / CGMCC 1.5162 / HZ254) TaxID=1041930 RepID=H8I8W2_METCZ|nr:hypothetical protein [Methanocella conradii]AFD00433.1 hypothetical protein Mtc_1687 [Methanocella conradii HZ254]